MAEYRNSSIATPRLVLRLLGPEYQEALHGVLSLPQVMRFSLHGPYSTEQTGELIQRCRSQYQAKGYGMYGVIPKEERKLIGYCGFLDQVIDGVDEVEIGYRLHPDYWGRGLATEAARAVRDFGFNTLGFERLISIIEPENTASIRVAEKNGMRLEKETMFHGAVKAGIYAVSRKGVDEPASVG